MSPAMLLAVYYHTENGSVGMRSIIPPVDESFRISWVPGRQGPGCFADVYWPKLYTFDHSLDKFI